MRASPKKNIKIDNKELTKTDIGHVKAICRDDSKYEGSFFYLIEFSKLGTFEIPVNQLDTF
tara:strand:- start:2102 stop:2284 length:183 start_codon:yes stop_codon:yes gene_type:complete